MYLFVRLFRTAMQIALVATCTLALSEATAATYFVANSGSDGNPGTNLAAPFQTIQHAAAMLTAGDTCYLRAGVYRETFLPLHNGTSNNPITFAAYSNEVVTISGANIVTNWTFWSNGIYQASVNWDLGEGYNQVFVDGIMMHEARLPNFGTGDLLHPVTASVAIDSTNTTVITSSAWSGHPDNYWVGAWFLGGVGYSWAWQCARVLGSTGNSVTVDPATESNPWFSGTGVGMLWGNLNLLDADNEWFLQTNTILNTLYLRIAGGDPSSHLVEMKRRNWCINFNGLNYIKVSNLNLEAGAVRLSGTGNVLENCRAQFLSHYLRFTSGYAENGNLDQGGGIVITGNSNTLRGCTIFDTGGSGIYCSGNNNLITRNLIYNTDYSGTYACGIALRGSQETVTFNSAYSSGRDILRPEGSGHDIRFNDLYGPGLLCKDLGVIYVWGVNSQSATGPSTRIAFNWVHDNYALHPAPLIYLDNWCANFRVNHNVCWNANGDAGVRVNGPAFGHQIYNNTLFNCTDVGTYPYDSWGNNNPDPAFWTNDVYQYSATNNLFLGSSPQTQLVNWTTDDFRLQTNAPAIDAGIVIPDVTDDYVGSAPDLGAYEFGGLIWKPGVDGWVQPVLTIAKLGGRDVTLSAPAEAEYFQLFVATNLTTAADWLPVTNAPALSSNLWEVTLPVTNTARFYRLQLLQE